MHRIAAAHRASTSGYSPWAAVSRCRLSNGPGDETEPSFSPDGAQIVFSERDSGVIKVVGAWAGRLG